MSDQDPASLSEEEFAVREELRLLKQRATMMGISFSNNIGLETLRAKVQAKMDGQADPTDEAQPVDSAAAATAAVNPLAVDPVVERKKKAKSVAAALRDRLYKENMRQIRIRIQCLDPKKATLHGEIITVGNEILGSVKKFVPFGEATDEGYHVPYIIYKFLKKRQFQHIVTRKNRKTGRDEVITSLMKEFAIEVLPPLTKEELQNLAQAQIAAGSVTA